MTDRELLELAAKAAGYVFLTNGQVCSPEAGNFDWNPLTSSADCAEMCAKLEISTLYFKGEKKISCGFLADDEPTLAHIEPYGDDREAAWRYAATQVAYEIGREMK